MDADQYSPAASRQRHRHLRTTLRSWTRLPEVRSYQPGDRQLATGFDLRLPTGSLPDLGQQLLLRGPEQRQPDADARNQDLESMVQYQRPIREEFRQWSGL